MSMILRFLINAIAIAVAARYVPGLLLSGLGAALMAAAILGLVNVLVRPVLLFLTLPFTLLTLGLFIFVVNAVCLMLTAALVPGFEVTGFKGAFLGALIISLVSWLLELLVQPSQQTARRIER
jgi:putative membrane protein